ncbi:MAG: AzlD domain-containing protein, partial [Roseococcus sp.]
LALLLLILACLLLRTAGLLVAGRLRPDHAFVRWAASVALATLTAFIAVAVVAPTGMLASIPFSARILGLLVAIGWLLRWGGLLAPLLAGLAATAALHLGGGYLIA